MRRWWTIPILLMAATVAGAGSVAFVDAERAVTQVDEGRRQLAALERWAEPRRQQVAELEGRLGEVRGRLSKQAAVASEETLAKLRAEETEVRRQLEEARRQFERDLGRKQDEFLADVAVKLGAVASAYGREQGFDAIFVLNAQPLIYVAESADVTDTVIRLYNERFPVGADGG